MENLEFWKMNGSGNDFVIIDNRTGRIHDEDMSSFVKAVCRRRESVGADGVFFIVKSSRYDFAWRFYNSDGGEAEMCGNGARCVARFAFLNGIAGSHMSFETLAGPVSAEVNGSIVKVLIPVPSGLKTAIELETKNGLKHADFINTGVPHVVMHVEDLGNHRVFEEGREIRYHSMFSPSGANANFIKVRDKNYIEIRTYERGVEDETLACGTGSIAAALTASARGMVFSPVTVKTRGGEELTVYFDKEGDSFLKVWLEGSTNIVFSGKLHGEALI
jgi:diaminopimelate epimerase